MWEPRAPTCFAEGEADRSATNSDVSAHAALQHAKGELHPQREDHHREHPWQPDARSSHQGDEFWPVRRNHPRGERDGGVYGEAGVLF
jgi:hypothetical protein